MLVVTHEMAFARDISTHVVYMNGGVICEEGTPQQIFNNPQKAETRDFLARFIAGSRHEAHILYKRLYGRRAPTDYAALDGNQS